MTTVKLLDKSTIQSLHSGQVIVDLEAIVKELIENSLDANATAIDFVFKSNGLESIQVKDNGDGIAESDRLCVAKRHYTSKIKAFKDLETIETYGFRGEAINAICAISDQFTIMTKTKEDAIGKQYTIDKNGNISNEKPVNTISTSGTIITLTKPFYDLPVRRQIAMKQGANNMKKIQELLVKYALAHPNVRFSSQSIKDVAAVNNKNMWIKPVTSSLESTMSMLFEASFTDMLEHFLETDHDHPTLSVDVVLPKANSDPSVILKGPDRVYVFVNNRPINYIKSELKDLITKIKNRYRDTIGLAENTTSKKTPFIYINIKISPDEYDVNIEPNKTTILFHNKQLVFDLIETKILDKIYPSKVKQFFQPIIPDENVAPITHIPTTTLNTNNTPIVVGAQDWSFNMDDSLEEIDELLSDSNTENEIQLPTKPATLNDYYVSTKPADKNNTPILTSHMTPPEARPSAPSSSSVTKHTSRSQNNTSTETSKSIIPKKRNIQVLLDSDDEGGLSHLSLASPKINNTTPPTQQRVHVPRVVPASSNEELPRNTAPPNVQTSPNIVSPTRISLPTTIAVPRPSATLHTKPPPQRSPYRKPISVAQLRDTFNETMIIDCNLQDIKATYPQRKEILSETYRIRIDEYLNTNNFDHPHQTTSLLNFPKGTLHDHLSLYTRGTPSTLDRHRHQVYQLGVVKLNQLSIEASVHKLMKEYKLVCKKPLERPVQIQMNHGDELCPMLISLKSKEQFVNDDMHGQDRITYSEIVDETVINNGFRVRWRKDLYSGNLIIQFTHIYSLGSGYGPSDFKELLALMMKETNDNSMVRPQKVVDHIHSLAQQIHHQQSNKDNAVNPLEEALDYLTWKKQDDWELGYGSNNKVLACMLAGSQQE